MQSNHKAPIAVVTGAAGGVGAATSAALADAGYRVALADLDEQAAEVLARRLERGSFAVRMDVGDAADVAHGVRRIATEGPIDVLVNNAGVVVSGSLAEMRADDWETACRVNLSSVFYCSKAVMESMMERRTGRIINISSISAVKAGGVIGNVLYGATKAGVNAFTKGFARELGPYGVTVNTIAPGLLATPMTRIRLTKQMHDNAISSIPAGRLGTPEDIAAAVQFLVSPLASYVNGAILNVDGGRLTV